MKFKISILKILFVYVLAAGCFSFITLKPTMDNTYSHTEKEQMSYLALGDSYTIGESVAEN